MRSWSLKHVRCWMEGDYVLTFVRRIRSSGVTHPCGRACWQRSPRIGIGRHLRSTNYGARREKLMSVEMNGMFEFDALEDGMHVRTIAHLLHARTGVTSLDDCDRPLASPFGQWRGFAVPDFRCCLFLKQFLQFRSSNSDYASPEREGGAPHSQSRCIAWSQRIG